MTEETKTSPGPATDSPFSRINNQIHVLDRALNTINGWTDESEHVRLFIVGQIEALKWALKQFEVG